MSGSAHNSWANVSQLSPGATLARVQAERWASDSNDAILAKLNDKIGGMLEGISDATERQAQEQIQEELLKRRGDLGAKFGKMPAAKFREEVVKLAIEAGLTPTERVSRRKRWDNFSHSLLLTSICMVVIMMQIVAGAGNMPTQVKQPGEYTWHLYSCTNAGWMVATDSYL